MKTKTCTKCKVSKRLDEFHARSASEDGRHTHCILCRSTVTPSMTKQVLSAIGDEPVTSTQIAKRLGIDSRACRSRMALLQKRRDIVWIGMAEQQPGEKRRQAKLYVRADAVSAMPIDTRLCHVSNEWLTKA